MKREENLVVLIFIILLLSVSFASASWFSDLFKKEVITGNYVKITGEVSDPVYYDGGPFFEGGSPYEGESSSGNNRVTENVPTNNFPCTIYSGNAGWTSDSSGSKSITNSNLGSTVYVSLLGNSGCKGKTVTVNIYDEDSNYYDGILNSDDDFVTSFTVSFTTSSSSITKAWTVKNPPKVDNSEKSPWEYYFNVVDSTGKYLVESAKIEVSFSNNINNQNPPSQTCSNSEKEGTEQCDCGVDGCSSTELRGATCASVKETGWTGNLKCYSYSNSNNCTWDIRECVAPSNSVCKQGDANCSNGNECCFKLCVNGACASTLQDCYPLSGKCSTDGTLYSSSGKNCLNGQCVTSTTCKQSDANCSNGNECCSKLCVNGACASTLQDCYPYNGKCSVDSTSYSSSGKICLDGQCVNSITCTDYDSVNSLTTKGRTTITTSTGTTDYWDKCENGLLLQYSCNGNSLSGPTSNSCLGTNSVCSDGACVNPCGNGQIDLGEFCDGSLLDGKSCAIVKGNGWTGTLTCKSDCKGFDDSQCTSLGNPITCYTDNDNDEYGIGNALRGSFYDDCGINKANNNHDCNDGVSTTNPYAYETCNDNTDNDCDGAKDCFDSECSSNSNCVTPPCISDWKTGDWGTCTNGQQSRNVYDSNSCTTPTGNKPSTTQGCTVSCTGSNYQTCSINNGQGTKYGTCVNGQWSYSGATCQVTSCNAGYHESNGGCVQNEISNQCTGSSTQSCSITNGVGSQSRTCNTGTGQWNNWENCNVFNCNSGYQISGNECIPIIIQPQKGCVINSIEWSENVAKDYDSLNIILSTSNCQGNNFDIKVYESDGTYGENTVKPEDDLVETIPFDSIVSQASIKNWIAKWNLDNDNEEASKYYLRAVLRSDNNKFFQSDLLYVNPVCGNLKKEGGEKCDLGELGGATCISEGYLGGGNLACASDCKNFDFSACRVQQNLCGNKNIDIGEVCDLTNLNEQTCLTRGYSGGTLTCGGDCKGFNEVNCTGTGENLCGNGNKDFGENCFNCPIDMLQIIESVEESIPVKQVGWKKHFKAPDWNEWWEYYRELYDNEEAARGLFDHYVSVGWTVGNKKMVDWKAAARKNIPRHKMQHGQNPKLGKTSTRTDNIRNASEAFLSEGMKE